MSQKERIRAMFYREVELSAIEIYLVTGISLRSVQKRIWELRQQGVIKKTDKFFNARHRKYPVFSLTNPEVKQAATDVSFFCGINTAQCVGARRIGGIIWY